MAFGKPHDLHTRRAGRNIGVGLSLIAFIAVIFGLTVAKINTSGPIQGYDHAPRPELADRVREN